MAIGGKRATPLATGWGAKLRRAAFLIALAGFVSTPTLAQIRTDGSVGAAAQSLAAPGGQYTIPQSLGRLAGTNLFHSFKDFNINSGEAATFTTSSIGISNVISRVTGGSVSNINGTLALRALDGAPALWFINPAGVAFGQGASIDLPGAFHVSTTHYLKFPDGKFYSDTQKVSTFSSAPPEAFGFLGTSRASIEVNTGAKLSNRDSTLNLIAGDITIDGSEVRNAAGALNLVAMGATVGEVSTNGVAPQAADGLIKIVNGAKAGSQTSSEVKAGDVSVTAGTLLVDSSVLSSKTTGSGNGGTVRIQVADAMSVLHDSYVGSSSSGAGVSGDVSVSAGTLLIDNSGLASDITGSGRGGAVSVQVAGDMKLQNRSYVTSDSFPEFDEGNLGDGGDVTVKAGRLFLDSSNIGSVTVGTGRGGAVIVQVAGEMKASNRSGVASLTFGSGNAGTTSVTAGNLLVDDSVISSDTFGKGRAGTVRVQIAGDMTVQNRSTVSSATRSTGNAGSVDLRVAGSIQVLSGSYVSSSTFGPGNAGDVSVTTGSLLIDPKGYSLGPTLIDSSSSWTEGVSLYPSGDAGTVQIRVAGELAVLNGGVISSGTFSPLGKAGSITVSAGQIMIDGELDYPLGSQPSIVTASAYSGSSGKTGSVMVTAAESITIQNKGAISIGNFATVATPEVLTGTTLSVTAPSIFLVNDGRVSARSTGNIAAGNVAVKFTNQLSINQTSTITTSAVDGNGGSIDISGQGLMTLDRSTITTSVTGASGNAGSVNIAAKTLL
ncbi:MAG: filamentous hemagglutinin N-terminal domain-containing protein, partial [Betaproteobacteria bacterium]|nr:filamentous hemagglutinin N-terminal domain-containing protein [Betaproteobacteria bacterium]